jgi:hypothetical protein
MMIVLIVSAIIATAFAVFAVVGILVELWTRRGEP